MPLVRLFRERVSDTSKPQRPVLSVISHAYVVPASEPTYTLEHAFLLLPADAHLKAFDALSLADVTQKMTVQPPPRLLKTTITAAWSYHR